MTLAEWLDEYRYLLDTSAEDDLKDIFAQHTKVKFYIHQRLYGAMPYVWRGLYNRRR